MQKPSEGFDKRSVGERRFKKRAFTFQDADLGLLRLRDCLSQEPALSDTGLPCEKDKLPLPSPGLEEALLEPQEVITSPNETRARDAQVTKRLSPGPLITIRHGVPRSEDFTPRRVAKFPS